jgi:hypothetical protein
VDVASCFWVEKGSPLTRLDVLKKMHSTMRHAVEREETVDAVVEDMKLGGAFWKSVLHVSVLGRVSEGTPRTAFPDEPLEVLSGTFIVVWSLSGACSLATLFCAGQRASCARS